MVKQSIILTDDTVLILAGNQLYQDGKPDVELTFEIEGNSSLTILLTSEQVDRLVTTLKTR